jgi:phage terminase large subunit-like protein
LSPGFVEGLRDRYAGTRLERQELQAIILDDIQGALFRREIIAYRMP